MDIIKKVENRLRVAYKNNVPKNITYRECGCGFVQLNLNTEIYFMYIGI